MKTNESRANMVHVLINNRPVCLDLENLRDSELAMRDDEGNYKTESGELHFTHQNAVKAAQKQGKCLLTNKEHKFVASLPHRWDDEKKGMWFKFPTRKQFRGLLRFINPLINYFTSVEVFFPAAGYRNSTTGALTSPGANGYYWSATVTGTNAYNLNFNSGNIYLGNTGNRAPGFSVRCVKD